MMRTGNMQRMYYVQQTQLRLCLLLRREWECWAALGKLRRQETRSKQAEPRAPPCRYRQGGCPCVQNAHAAEFPSASPVVLLAALSGLKLRRTSILVTSSNQK
jgi:hypothetical protein